MKAAISLIFLFSVSSAHALGFNKCGTWSAEGLIRHHQKTGAPYLVLSSGSESMTVIELQPTRHTAYELKRSIHAQFELAVTQGCAHACVARVNKVLASAGVMRNAIADLRLLREAKCQKDALLVLPLSKELLSEIK